MLAPLQEKRPDLKVSDRGRANRRRVDQLCKFLQGACGIRPVSFCYPPRRVVIGVIDGGKDAILELRTDPRVVLAHMSHADDAGAKSAHSLAP